MPSFSMPSVSWQQKQSPFCASTKASITGLLIIEPNAKRHQTCKTIVANGIYSVHRPEISVLAIPLILTE